MLRGNPLNPVFLFLDLDDDKIDFLLNDTELLLFSAVKEELNPKLYDFDLDKPPNTLMEEVFEY